MFDLCRPSARQGRAGGERAAAHRLCVHCVQPQGGHLCAQPHQPLRRDLQGGLGLR